MALEMKVFKNIGDYEPKPMFGLTWRQQASVLVMLFGGGGVFALVTWALMSHGSSMKEATNVAMLLAFPVMLPAAFWGWWRPKGLKPEKYGSFALRDLLMEKEVVYGNAAVGNDKERVLGAGAGSGSRAEAKARKRQARNLRKSVAEREAEG